MHVPILLPTLPLFRDYSCATPVPGGDGCASPVAATQARSTHTSRHGRPVAAAHVAPRAAATAQWPDDGSFMLFLQVSILSRTPPLSGAYSGASLVVHSQGLVLENSFAALRPMSLNSLNLLNLGDSISCSAVMKSLGQAWLRCQLHDDDELAATLGELGTVVAELSSRKKEKVHSLAESAASQLPLSAFTRVWQATSSCFGASRARRSQEPCASSGVIPSTSCASRPVCRGSWSLRARPPRCWPRASPAYPVEPVAREDFAERWVPDVRVHLVAPAAVPAP